VETATTHGQPVRLQLWAVHSVNTAKAAVEIIYRKVEDKDKAAEEYANKFSSPLPAAQKGYLDDIITPSETRAVVIADLEMLRGKKVENPWKKHGNIPL
jgi:propionyl-CoA carboxylase beta chain